MMRDDGGTGAAFPEAYWPTPDSDQPNYRSGMSLRDWFAGQALAGMLAGRLAWVDPGNPVSEWATHAYEFADAMLAERIRKDVKGEGG